MAGLDEEQSTEDKLALHKGKEKVVMPCFSLDVSDPQKALNSHLLVE